MAPPDEDGPSPAALNRQAEGKEILARSFDNWAKQLDGFLEGVSTAPKGRDVWTGPAADRFGGLAKRHRDAALRLAETCRTTAGNLRRSAQDLREQAKGLKR